MMVRTGLDWEAWRPTWQENAARPGGEPDQDVDQLESIALVKHQHPDWTDAAQVIPPLPSLFTLLRPYLAHFFPVFSRFLCVFTASPRRFQRAASRNPGTRNSRHGCPNSRKHRFSGRANSGCSERMVEPRSAMEVGLLTIVAMNSPEIVLEFASNCVMLRPGDLSAHCAEDATEIRPTATCR